MKSMHGKTFYWCAKCKRWTTSHKTSEHKSKESTTTGVTTTTSSNHISLMAQTDFSAWHVNIDTQRTDAKAKENYWLTMVNNFITNFIFLPLQFILLFCIGIGIFVLGLIGVLSVTTCLGYGTIAPILWILSLLLFAHLQPIFSYVPPPDPPPPLLRWQKRKIKKWMSDEQKKCKKTTTPAKGIESFHRSYPLRLRNDGIYRGKSELYMHRDAVDRRADMLRSVQVMEDRMRNLYRDNRNLVEQNKLLTAQRDSLTLYNPTPFERETESPEEREKQLQTALDDIHREMNVIRGGVDYFDHASRCFSHIAAFATPPARTFLNIIQTSVSMLLNSNSTNIDVPPKTVIWDSGSSMSITNDRTEFMVGEYEALPPDRTITGISDSKVQIHGVGMVSWSFEDTSGTIRTLELPCLFVPSCKQRGHPVNRCLSHENVVCFVTQKHLRVSFLNRQ